MIDCIIIDDEQHAVDVLEHYVAQVPYLNLIAATTDPLAGLALLGELVHGVVFLDVQMPNLTGVELLKLIKPDTRVIMTTAYKEYALDGFEHAVVDYLLKPIAFPRFLKAVSRLTATGSTPQAATNGHDAFLFVKSEQKGKLLKVDIRRIIFIVYPHPQIVHRFPGLPHGSRRERGSCTERRPVHSYRQRLQTGVLQTG